MFKKKREQRPAASMVWNGPLSLHGASSPEASPDSSHMSPDASELSSDSGAADWLRDGRVEGRVGEGRVAEGGAVAGSTDRCDRVATS